MTTLTSISGSIAALALQASVAKGNNVEIPSLGITVDSSLTEREATYQASLKLVAIIDHDLTRGIRHYRNKGGVLLTTLDEVVRAILANDLAAKEAA